MTIREQLAAMPELIGGKAWGLDKGKPRIYLPSRRDMKVYFAFDDAAYSSPTDEVSGAVTLGGARLCVQIDDCGQHPNWYAGQKAKVAEAQRLNSLALMVAEAGDFELARRVVANGVDDDDEFAGHVINGRLTEAAALVLPD
jgi:hypothetical protein